jgi:hypothetical protein
MRLKLPERFKLSAPARKVVLLPDTHFFCRTVPITAGAAPAEAAAQVELALEGLAPFPLGQLYHGHFWRPGAKSAFVFAAYRKRFPVEQVETWADAEAVLPAFASMLNAQNAGSTTLLLWSEKNLTAIRWEESGDAPVSVIARDLPLELTFADHAAVRDTVLRESGATINVVESTTAPALDNTTTDDDFVFRCEHADSTFTREQLDVLDVRDKVELASRRRARKRDLWLWRVLLGSAAVILLSMTLEFVLIGGKIWQKSRTAMVDRQESTVSKIMLAQSLAMRIEELSTKRMRPFEMISMVSEKLPASVVFLNTTVKNLNTLVIEAQTSNPSDVDAFRSALSNMVTCQNVEFKGNRLQNGQTTFQLVVTFKSDAFNPTPQS